MMPSSEPPQPAPGKEITSFSILTLGFVAFLLSTTSPNLFVVIVLVLSQVVPYVYRVNDHGESRRKLWAEWAKKGDLPQAWRDVKKNVNVKESYWINERGASLFTVVMTPKSGDIIAVVCYCHGFGDTVGYLKQIHFEKFVKQGIAVVCIEYEGFGRSDGLLGFVPSWDNVVDDVTTYFKEITEERFQGKKCFLMGESMGGAISYNTYERNPSMWSGVVFQSPMLKVSDEMLPPQWVVTFIRALIERFSFIGWLPITPSANLSEQSFKLEWKRCQAIGHPGCYDRKSRLVTSREFLNTTMSISKNCHKFEAPFCILHGSDDKVTCSKYSQMFFDASISKDKEIKIYEGMWHNLWLGEEDEDADKVVNDAISWITSRI